VKPIYTFWSARFWERGIEKQAEEKFVLVGRWGRGKMTSGHAPREDALSLTSRRDEGVISLDAETLHSRSGGNTKVKKRASMCV
jgi:hypothetical protein